MNHLFRKLVLVYVFLLAGLHTSHAKEQSTPCHGSVLICDMQSCYRGSEIYNLALYKHLKDAGVDVHFFVRNGSKMQHKLSSKKLPHHKPAQKSGDTLVDALRKVVVENGIDIIHCTQPSEAKNARMVAKETGAKVILTNHMGRKFSKSAIATIDGLICVNSEVAADTARAEKAMSDYIKWIPPLFDEGHFRMTRAAEDRVAFYKENFKITVKKDVPIFTCIAQIGKHKNQELIVKAMGILKNRGIETQAVFAGNGNGKALKTVAVEYGLEKNIHPVGFTNNVPGILANSDVNLLVSASEGLGIALVEGAIMRLPSICSDIPGPRTLVVNGKTGLTIKPNDVVGLADALEIYCTNPETAKTFGQAIYKHFEETFSTKVVLERIIDFYNLVLAA